MGNVGVRAHTEARITTIKSRGIPYTNHHSFTKKPVSSMHTFFAVEVGISAGKCLFYTRKNPVESSSSPSCATRLCWFAGNKLPGADHSAIIIPGSTDIQI